MEDLYKSFKCKKCEGEFVLVADDVLGMEGGRYLSCPYCSSKHIVVDKVGNSIRDCMSSEHSYVRHKGAMRQRR